MKVVTDIGPIPEFPQAEYDRIVQETKDETARGPQVLAASYDAPTGLVSFSLKGGATIGYPARQLPGLDAATDDQLADIEPRAEGTAIHWDSLDVQYTTPALLQIIFNLPTAAGIGAKGGRSTSESKLAAIRENGKKGGRPRKKTEIAATS